MGKELTKKLIIQEYGVDKKEKSFDFIYGRTDIFEFSLVKDYLYKKIEGMFEGEYFKISDLLLNETKFPILNKILDEYIEEIKDKDQKFGMVGGYIRITNTRYDKKFTILKPPSIYTLAENTLSIVYDKNQANAYFIRNSSYTTNGKSKKTLVVSTGEYNNSTDMNWAARKFLDKIDRNFIREYIHHYILNIQNVLKEIVGYIPDMEVFAAYVSLYITIKRKSRYY